MKAIHELPDAHLRIFERPAPPPPDQIRTVYLIGICGTGMGSLAGLLQAAGYEVSGSDENVYPPMSTQLANAGIKVYQGFDPAHLDPAPDVVVVGNACTPRHVEAAYAREKGLVQLSLPEALRHFFLNHSRTLVVAGTHGKTTTTGLLIHVLKEAGLDPSFLVGGVMVNSQTSHHVGTGKHFVLEGDEYDSAYFDKRPKFLHYGPASAILTSMEFDHADIYEGWEDYREAFQAFAATVPKDGLLALYHDDPEVRALSASTSATVWHYGLDEGSAVTATRIVRGEGGQRFMLVQDGKELTEVFLPMSGRHNLRNALGVAAIALSEGVSPEHIARAMATFRGMKRRQEVRGEAGGVLVLDDFAHHPTAVRETVAGIAERWSARRLIAVFEPRSNSSRRKVFEQAYSEAFDQAAAVFLSAPPLRYNDSPEDFMDAFAVGDQLRAKGINAQVFPSADALLPALIETCRPGDVVLIMSNGSFGGLHDRLLDALRASA